MADLSLSALGTLPQYARPEPSLANLGNYGPRVLPSGYNTQLDPGQEQFFRQWLQHNNVPFNPNAGMTDYDMRGFYQASQQGQPNMSASINPNDGRMHYPDRFKTPLHETFSRESQWAGSDAPQWVDDHRQASGGRIIFDERR